MRYKSDEGRNSRQTAFWMGLGMLAFGCYSLRTTLDRWVSLRDPLFSHMEKLPIVGITLSPSLVISLAVFVSAAVLGLRILAKPKVADHLIEVENEMKKVTWPSFKDASNSSIVVILAVLFLMGFLALSDYLLGEVFQVVLWSRV
ncbi:MAG: preprotein translocase subunit SecE [Planctomycetota bacterium]